MVDQRITRETGVLDHVSNADLGSSLRAAVSSIAPCVLQDATRRLTLDEWSDLAERIYEAADRLLGQANAQLETTNGGASLMAQAHASTTIRHPGWIVSNADETMFREWLFGPSWTTNRTKALRFARRIDAENFCAEDQDAWKILEVGDADKSAPLTSQAVREAMTDAWNEICSDTGCHPNDIIRDFEGKRGHLGFDPGQWAHAIARRLLNKETANVSG